MGREDGRLREMVWGPNAAICATGTTITKAGSKEDFRSVDHSASHRIGCTVSGYLRYWPVAVEKVPSMAETAEIG